MNADVAEVFKIFGCIIVCRHRSFSFLIMFTQILIITRRGIFVLLLNLFFLVVNGVIILLFVALKNVNKLQ